MDDALALDMVHSLRRLTVQQADAELCQMHRDTLHRIGAALGLRLPLVGGDKPALICGALFRKGG